MYKLMRSLAVAMATLGGVALSALIVMTCLSILGRELNAFVHSDGFQAVAPGLGDWLVGLGLGPITGDFELVESGVAFAIFAFLPYCQLTDGHATVDVFSSRFPDRLNRVLRAVFDVTFAIVLIVIAWRLSIGMDQKRGYGETTFLLQFPIWWAYAASLLGASLAAIVGTYVAVLRVAEAVTGHALLPRDEAHP